MLKKYPLSTLFSILVATLVGCVGLVEAIIIQNMLKAVEQQNADKIMHITIGIAVYVICYGFLFGFHKTIDNLWVRKITLFLKAKIYRSILRLDYKNFCKREKTEYLALLTDFMPYVEGFYQAKKDITVNVAILIISLFFIGYFNLPFMLCMVGLMLIYHFIKKYIMEQIRQQVNRIQTAKNQLYADVVNAVSNFSTIREMQAEEYFMKKHRKSVEYVSDGLRKYQYLYNIADIAFFTVQCVLISVTLVIGFFLVEKNKEIIVVLIAINEVVAYVLQYLMQIESSEISKKGCKEYYDLTLELENEAREQKLLKHSSFSEKSFEEITLSHISFHYGEKKIIDDLSVSFKQGKKYAIVGKSGCGKSTLLNILLKNLQPDEGNITLCGCDYCDLSTDEVQSLIAYVPQESFLFHDTILNNICLEKNFIESDYQDVLQKFSVDRIVEKFSKKNQTMISYKGNLSEGEKQRITIARAIYTDKPIILLDECTSALDPELSEKIENELLKLEGKTIIAVTHKLKKENYSKYDEVILEN